MSIKQSLKEAYDNGYDDGLLKGSEVGDAAARRARQERDEDMSRLQRERIEWVKERDALRAALEDSYRTIQGVVVCGFHERECKQCKATGRDQLKKLRDMGIEPK